MTALSRRFESLATRCATLGDGQGAIFHRFLGRIQAISDQIKSISFEELADVLEKAVACEEEESTKGGRSE